MYETAAVHKSTEPKPIKAISNLTTSADFVRFSGDAELASILSENGWYASFAGTVTFKNAPNLRDALENLPRRLVLIETDSPFLTPVPFRGRPNSSYLIPHTLRAMAAHLGTDVTVLAALISSNTEEVYGRWNDEPVAEPPSPLTA